MLLTSLFKIDAFSSESGDLGPILGLLGESRALSGGSHLGVQRGHSVLVGPCQCKDVYECV